MVLTVEDEGQGIAQSDLNRIFSAFEQGSQRERPLRNKSVGLGLAIVRKLAEAHGGSVRAENRTGGGARFEVFLPAG